MRIVLSNTGGAPIYEQIREQIKASIFSGELAEGEALPSIRQLARDLKISVITTTRAYGDLEREGFITSIQGKGCFVLPKNSELIREQSLREIEAGFTAAIAAARSSAIEKAELMTIFETIIREEAYE